MKRKKKHLYAGVLLIGALALLADRLLGPADTGPQPASAQQDRQALGAVTDELQPRPTNSIVAAPFPGPLAEPTPGAPLRDVFELSQRVQDILNESTSDDPRRPGSKPNKPPPFDPQAFAGAHRLSAVMISGGVASALIDGRWVREGESLDPCVLTTLTGTTASFTCFGETVTLSVVQSSKSPSAP